MNVLIAVFVALVSFVAFADERVPLWPEGKIPDFQPHQIASMKDGVNTNADWKAAHRMPFIEWFDAPAKPNGGCMILISGGSYKECCDIGLIKMWRTELTKLGFQCVNLVYRTPRPNGLAVHQSAWEDGQRAVRLVRADAKKRKFDPEKIGVIGMSAGGHLATMLATSALTPAYAKIDALDKIPCYVNWCIAHAPAYNTLGAAKGDARPQDGTTEIPTVNPCFKFDAKTCPISFHHGGKDKYTPNGSTLCYRELRKRKVPAELHLYADKGHGAHGFERAVEFMRQMEFLGKLPKEEPLSCRLAPTHTNQTEKEMLWPSGKMPGAAFTDRKRPKKTGGALRESEPYLVWYVPEKLTTKAIQIVFPGGGYQACNYKDEGAPVAHYLNGKGMTTVVVVYRCPRPKNQPKHYLAWQDAQRAIRIIRAEAPKRGLDPNRIGAMGFSAGGHLALMAALSSGTNAYEPVDEIDKLSCAVQWACPVYPAYVLTDGADGVNAHGGNLDEDVFVPEFLFDAGTPPMCFLHGDADGISPMGSVKIWEKLRTMGVQCDLHTFAKRGHCFQVSATPGTGSYNWLDRIWDFISAKKFNR